MGKTLLLLRHGKSDWDADYSEDHERPLAPRGVRAAKLMGRLLADARQVPDLAISSTALRSRNTLELAIESGSWTCPMQSDHALYETDPDSVLERLQNLPPEVNSVLLAGHECAWSELTALLIGGGRIRIPTAAVVRIDFEREYWKNIQSGDGELVWLQIPRFFKKPSKTDAIQSAS